MERRDTVEKCFTKLGNVYNAIKIHLPPVYPRDREGREPVAVVIYIRRAERRGLGVEGGETRHDEAYEVGICPNPRYEQIEIPLPPEWDGNPSHNPSPSYWPTVTIESHYPYPQGPLLPSRPTTQDNYRFPGRQGYPGDSTSSAFGNFREIENLYIHDVEVCDFAGDGVNISDIKNSRFERLHVHHNGRNGIAIVSNKLHQVDFSDCVIELNEYGGVDLEPFDGQGLRWNQCSFLKQDFGVSIGGPVNLTGPDQTEDCVDLEFTNCIFDYSYLCHIKNGGLKQNISNLKISGRTFLNNYQSCIVFGSDTEKRIEGRILGCKFEEATGRVAAFEPFYYIDAQDVPMIVLGYNTKFQIANNDFMPWYWY